MKRRCAFFNAREREQKSDSGVFLFFWFFVFLFLFLKTALKPPQEKLERCEAVRRSPETSHLRIQSHTAVF